MIRTEVDGIAVTEASVLLVRSGDILLVTIPEDVAGAPLEDFGERLKHVLETLNLPLEIFFLPEGFKFSVIRKG